ncbi:MAG TPA: hypothetical protein VGC16_06180 [Rhizomicrobium sp.]
MSSDETAFRLSRVYAQGWNAAQKLPPDTKTEAKTVAAGPYAADPERALWRQGFSDGSA